MNDIHICVKEALNAFFDKIPNTCDPYGNGHINDTFLVVADKKYILQKINGKVFPKPEELLANMLNITKYINSATAKTGASSLNIVPTLDGKNWFCDSCGRYWRLTDFVEGSVTYEKIEDPQDFYKCGKGFGIFQRLLSDYPADTLFEPIANFHNTPWRYENLMKAVKNDKAGRAASVEKEIAFAKDREAFTHILEDANKAGELPLRVTHNDTKINNILFDKASGEPICVIDLDTVMSGYSVTDFGDSIRFGANTAAEDETDLSKVSLDLDLFRACAKGFLEGCGGSLTAKELELLPVGAIMMTLECGMRFLTDHLDGDVYFKIHRENHNLDRARNQFALVADMEKKLEDMKAIINELK